MSCECFICDRHADEFLAVYRFDGTEYKVPMCLECLTETTLRSRQIRFAHELIDARNDFRARHRVIADQGARTRQRSEQSARSGSGHGCLLKRCRR